MYRRDCTPLQCGTGMCFLHSIISLNLHQHQLTTRNLMFVRCSNSSSNILVVAHQNTQTIIDATQKETAIDQQQHSCEKLICRHQTILRLLSSAATASTLWQVRGLYCRTTYGEWNGLCSYKVLNRGVFIRLYCHALWNGGVSVRLYSSINVEQRYATAVCQ